MHFTILIVSPREKKTFQTPDISTVRIFFFPFYISSFVILLQLFLKQSMSAVVQEKLYSVQVGRGAGPSVKLEKLKISRLPLCNNTTTAIILCKDYLKNISAVSMQQHHQQQGSQIIFTRPKKNYSTQKSFLFNIRDLLHMIQGYRILLKLVILYLCLMRAFHDIHLQNVFLIISNSSSPESLITLSK